MPPVPPAVPPEVPASTQRQYWASTRRLTLGLFMVWLLATFSVIFFARELSGLTLFGWPVSYYMAAQGTTLAYLAIVGLYAWRMRHLDRRYREDVRDVR